MKPTQKLFAVSALALLLCAPAALAQTVEQSPLPVDEPLDVGGTILQPGSYMIKVLGNGTDRDRVVITNADGTKTFATVLTVPHHLEPNEEVPSTTYVFYPPGDNSPKALRTWFAGNPPTLRGRDIVYAEDRARQLARLAKAEVVFHAPQTPVAQLETATLQVVTPEAKVETYTYTPPAAPGPMVSSTETTTSDVDMPTTASNLPLVALLGVLSLAGAAVIRRVRVG